MKRIPINTLSVLAIVVLFSLEGCFLFPISPEVLPPATQTGANTFGFLLNGKVWLPQGGSYPSLNVQYYKGLFLLSAHKDSGKETSQGIYQIFQSISWSYKPIYGSG